MNPNESTVTLHVASSLDGFIAGKDNAVSWMDTPDYVYAKGISEGDAMDSFKPIDCFVLGSRTYEHARFGNIWSLGDGLHLFSDSGAETKWQLKDVVAYKNSFVELVYRHPAANE